MGMVHSPTSTCASSTHGALPCSPELSLNVHLINHSFIDPESIAALEQVKLVSEKDV